MVQTKQSKKKKCTLLPVPAQPVSGRREGLPSPQKRPGTHLLRLAVLIMRGGKVLGAKDEEDRNSTCEARQRSGVFLFEFLA